MQDLRKLLAACVAAKDYLEAKKGYTRAEFSSLTVHETYLDVSFVLRDEFQKDLDHREQHQYGYHALMLNDWPIQDCDSLIAELHTKLSKLDGRNIRELKVIMAASARLTERTDDFVGEFSKAFLADLVAKRLDIAGLLTKQGD